MTRYTAGRFMVDVHVGASNGEMTQISELHRNGSDEVMGMLTINKTDLLDLWYVLKRAMRAHRVEP